ncbi:hypothetical protein [Pseudonocardia sp. N23]|uniref:hypothetical protein n=1 Tax=Pseudonocardia sp. N23 TaxID=1987376 RepID=UPI000BFE3C23|nr:hypothetical protein [Pseudonocardia sp. N23]GAY07919.1 hypothetical protein TOK_5633 [Pseudonocardia sp. N23]
MPRSYDDYQPGQQLYTRIEFVRNAEALWAKIESGRYDWLGVAPEGQYVLGSPPTQRLGASPGGVSMRAGTVEEHRIEFRGAGESQPGARWFASSHDARAGFDSFVAERGPSNGGKTGIWRVTLFQDGDVVDEATVVRATPNYYGGAKP